MFEDITGAAVAEPDPFSRDFSSVSCGMNGMDPVIELTKPLFVLGK